ncbi:hypothetical protein MP638_001031 [Amoeboaphelidium occidentale]|nr:hypothetical protein MP638_001031 [Amoeboaphelidium occidentale]
MEQIRRNDLFINTKLLDKPEELDDDFITAADALLQRQREVRQAIAELRLSGYTIGNRNRPYAASDTQKTTKDMLNSPDINGKDQNRNHYARRCLEEYLAQRKAKEEEELIRDFKARPAPATFRVPILQKVTEKQKDHHRIMMEREKLTRETLKKRLNEAQKRVIPNPQFKARPLPKYLESRPKLSPEIKAQKAYKDDFEFVPKKRKEVPDFRALQYDFQVQLEMGRLKYYEDMGKIPVDRGHKRQQTTKKESNLTQESKIARNMTLRKPRVTRSFTLMKQATEKKIAEFNRRDREAKAKLARNTARKSLLGAKIRHALRYTDKLPSDKRSHNSNVSSEAKFAQNSQYRQHLDDVYKNLGERPCMFERISIERAIKKANQYYEDIISHHGLDKGKYSQNRR